MSKSEVIARIREFTGHDHIQIMPSGNAAIYTAFYLARKINKKAAFLVPDQAGWLTYLDYPKLFGLNLQEIKTNQGIIDLDDLKKHAKEGTALIYQNPAGYFAEQPAKQIYDLCQKANCPVIMDVSGSIGTDMCNGDYADLMVCSFGKWKIIENFYGGFISAKNQTLFDQGKPLYQMMKVHPLAYEEILKKISQMKGKLNSIFETRKKVLEDLKEMDIIHRDKKGLNVIVKFSNDQEKEKILNYCKNHQLEYTECPRYIRVNEPAISIEIKR